MALESSFSDGEDDDLDGILDDALQEFDVGPVPEPPCLAGSSDEVPASSIPLAEDDALSALTDRHGVALDGSAPDVNADVRAFEEAISSLNSLPPNGAAGSAGNGEHTEEEDLKLVEDFLKSLSSQFESMGLAEDGGSGPAGASASGADAALAAAATAAADGGGEGDGGKMPSEAEIDQLTRDLEALLRTEGGNLGAGAAPDAAQGEEADGRDIEIPAGDSSNNTSRADGTADGAPASGSAGGEEFNKIVESVVGELLSKEVLEGPMEQMRDAYGEWLPQNVESLNKEEAERYRKQADIVNRICTEYGKDDSKMANVMALLTEMQSTGSPPQAVMAKLGTGDDASSGDAAKNLDTLLNPADCPVQ